MQNAPNDDFDGLTQDLRRMAYRLSADPDQADDAVQEVLLRIIKRPPNGVANTEGWLRQVLHNELITRSHQEKRRKEREHKASRPEALAKDEDDGHPGLERLTSALRKLPNRYRSVMEEYYLNGRTIAGVSRTLGLPPETVRTRLRRARAKLKSSVGGNRAAWLLLPALSRRRLVRRARRAAPAWKAAGVLLLTAPWVALAIGWIGEPKVSELRNPDPSVSVLGDRVSITPTSTDRRPLPVASEASASAASNGFDVPYVLMDPDGHRLPGVQVQYVQDGEETEGSAVSSTSDAAGEGVLVGISGWGTLAPTGDDWVAYASPAVRAHEPAEPLPLVLAPTRTLRGRVVDEHGVAIPRASVLVTGTYQSAPLEARPELQLRTQTTACDDDGRFELAVPDLPSVRLACFAQGHGRRTSTLTPNSPDYQELKLGPTVKEEVTGRILTSSGLPVVGAFVSLGRDGTRTDSDGVYRLRIQGGSPDELSLRAASPAGWALTSLRVSSPQDVRLEPTAVIQGRVVAAGQPVQEARVWLRHTTYLGLWQKPKSIEAALSGDLDRTWVGTDSSGSFELPARGDRAYVVMAEHPVSGEVIDCVDVRAGQWTRMDFDDLSGVRPFSGRIVDRNGRPRPKATVVLLREHQQMFQESTRKGAMEHEELDRALSDDRGEFRFHEVPSVGAVVVITGDGLMPTVHELGDQDSSTAPRELEVCSSRRVRFESNSSDTLSLSVLARDKTEQELLLTNRRVRRPWMGRWAASKLLVHPGQSKVVELSTRSAEVEVTNNATGRRVSVPLPEPDSSEGTVDIVLTL